MAPRDYARLHFEWYRDPVIVAVADEAPCVMSVWPVLIALTKEKSHHLTNPAGAVEVSAGGLAAITRCASPDVARCLELLVDGELIKVEPLKVGLMRLELTDFAEWQVPRKGKAEQQQAKRDAESASRDFVDSRGSSVGVASPSVRLETGEKGVSPSLRSGSPDTAGAEEKPAPGPSAEQVRGVFEFWRQLFGRATTVKLDEKRRRRIVWALRTYGREGVAACLRGYANDREWPRDTATKNEIATLLRDAAHVDAGIEKYEAQQGRAPRPGAPKRNTIAEMGYS